MMNRRKAIIRISLAGTAIIGAMAGYKWYSLVKSPDREYLVSKKDLLNALADTIIPPTDTPGAAQAGVGDYMLRLLLNCTDRKHLNVFTDGLKDLEEYCDDHFGRSFIKCSAEEREKTLAHFEKNDKISPGIMGKIRHRYLGDSFFYTLKNYTVEGYCRSKLGATQALAYVYIPGSFTGCTPMQPGQKSWATN